MPTSGTSVEHTTPPTASTVLRVAGLACSYLVLFLLLSCIVPLFLDSAGMLGSWAWAATTLRADVLVPLVALPVFLTVLCGFVHTLVATHALERAERRLTPVIRQVGLGKVHRGVSVRHRGPLRELGQELDRSLEVLHDNVEEVMNRHGHAMKALRQVLEKQEIPDPHMDALAESMETVNETLHRLQLRPRESGSLTENSTGVDVVHPLETTEQEVKAG